MQDKKRVLTGDIVIIAAVLAVALIFSLSGLLHNNQSPEYFTVQTDQITQIYPLHFDALYEITSNGINLLLEVKEGAVGVVKAGCPDKSCMKMGKVENYGDVIICLPAKVMIKAEGQAGDGGQDALAG